MRRPPFTKQVYMEGWQAFIADVPLESCPYNDTGKAYSWRTGWLDSEKVYWNDDSNLPF